MANTFVHLPLLPLDLWANLAMQQWHGRCSSTRLAAPSGPATQRRWPRAAKRLKVPTSCTSQHSCYLLLAAVTDMLKANWSLFSPSSFVPFPRKTSTVYILLQMHNLLPASHHLKESRKTSALGAVKTKFEAIIREFSSFLSEGNTHKSG